MFRVKICGVKSPADAALAAQAGADAIGLNFYAPSARYVQLDLARQIAAGLPANVLKVGLFVNSPVEQVRDIVTTAMLDAIQLHGDESPEFVASLRHAQVIKAFRVKAGDERAVVDFVSACDRFNAPLAAVLVDAFHPGSYGGTGQTTDWAVAASLVKQLTIPLILAGGLKVENVAAAIKEVHPFGVDTASGVESAPGIKDPQLVKAFVTAAQGALT